MLTKITASKNEVVLSYHRVRGLYFLAAVLAATVVITFWYLKLFAFPKPMSLSSFFKSAIFRLSSISNALFLAPRETRLSKSILQLRHDTFNIAPYFHTTKYKL